MARHGTPFLFKLTFSSRRLFGYISARVATLIAIILRPNERTEHLYFTVSRCSCTCHLSEFHSIPVLVCSTIKLRFGKTSNNCSRRRHANYFHSIKVVPRLDNCIQILFNKPHFGRGRWFEGWLTWVMSNKKGESQSEHTSVTEEANF